MTAREILIVAVLIGAAILAAALAGCPRGPASTSASPTPRDPGVAVTANPVPLVAVRDDSAASSRYRVTAELSFKELGGQPVRITKLKVDIVASGGWSAASTQDADLAIAASGVASETLTTVIEATGPADAGRWRLTATAARPDGQLIPVAPIESELRFTGAPAPAANEVFVGAGDIAKCGVGDAEATAKLLDRIPGTVFTLGDNVQDAGADAEYANCFEPTWGRHRSRMLPTVGNHDWFGGHGRPYFSYFGASAGPAGLGYYSQTVGAWHVISLNSEIPAGPGSPQYEWLKADLAASPAACTLAMWHRPLFTSGPNENAAHMRDAWRLLGHYGAELVLSGHNHMYERFAPQDADGRADPRGPRQFVVGTGGYPLYGRARAQAHSEVLDANTWGVLKLTLKSASYAWEFVPVAGKSFRDSGSGTCIVRTIN